MNKIKIGVSGNVGSFSEEAGEYYCHKNKVENYKLDYLVSVGGVLSELVEGKINKGVFPIENSNGGIVYEAVYAMAKYNFNIEDIFEIDVRHNLLVKKKSNRGNIKKIASHPQAIKQCKMYIKRIWPEAEIIEWSDTAQAAKDLSEGKLGDDTAVIAPLKSAEIYNLDVLEEKIQDLKFNFTTFVVATS